MVTPQDARRELVRRRAEQDLRNDEAMQSKAPARNTAGGGASVNTGDTGGGVISFASDAAAELAAQHDLGPAAFRGREPSGKNGYTLADVRALIPADAED